MASPRKPEHFLTNSPPKGELASASPTLYLPRVEPGRIFGALLRRAWIAVLCMAVTLGAMFAYLKKVPKIYISSGSVNVFSTIPDPLRVEGFTQDNNKDLEQLRTIEGDMASSAVMLRVVRANHLDKAEDFVKPGTSEQAAANFLRLKRVHVELERGTRNMNIVVEDTDPVRAKRLVESVVEEYQLWTKERREAVARQASEGLATTEKDLREARDATEKALQDFREQHPVPGLDAREGSATPGDPLGNLNTQLSSAKAERLRLESEYEAFKKFDPQNPDALAGIGRSAQGDEVMARVRALQAKELEFTKAKETYLHKHPVYKELASEVDRLKLDLAESVRSAGEALEKSYHVALENEAKLGSEVNFARTAAVGVEGLRAQYDLLRRNAEAARTRHADVDQRLRSASLVATLVASPIEWKNVPFIPETPSKPAKPLFMAVAGLAGLFGGLVLMLGTELRDGRVRDAAAARATGAPLLASLPVLQGSGEGDMILLSNPGSPVAEAFRRLRAVLLPPPAKPNARTVLFASAVPGEGRSLCAMNYAASLAMQGQRTLLLDADMRRPGLSRKHAETGGLGAYLAGEIEPASACFPTALPNLYLLSSGPMRTDAAELLSGTRLPVLLEDAYRWFDAVVIDSPPVLAVSDALAISRYADRVCLVVRQDASERRNLRKAAELVRSSGGNLIGFVWNECPIRGKGTPAPEPVVPLSHPALSSTGVAVANGPTTAHASTGENQTSPIA